MKRLAARTNTFLCVKCNSGGGEGGGRGRRRRKEKEKKITRNGIEKLALGHIRLVPVQWPHSSGLSNCKLIVLSNVSK